MISTWLNFKVRELNYLCNEVCWSVTINFLMFRCHSMNHIRFEAHVNRNLNAIS